MIIRPNIFKAFPHLIAAQSTRLGGNSQQPFDSLNLGLYTQDHEDHVDQNRTQFFNQLGFQPSEVSHSHQVHSSEILWDAQAGGVEGYDALVTQKSGVLLSVTVADCTPILIYDELRQVIAAVHAGWKGTVGGIVSKVLAGMKDRYGTVPQGVYAYIGPCICQETFEVDADVADRFTKPYKGWDAAKEKYLVDLKGANRDQLIDFGVPAHQIEISPHSTVLQNDLFFSHRKEKGQTGRLLAVIAKK